MEEEPKKFNYISKVLKIVILLAIVVFVTYHVTVNVTLKKFLSKTNTEYMKAKMSLIKTELEKNSIYTLDEEKMVEYAIKGYTLRDRRSIYPILN